MDLACIKNWHRYAYTAMAGIVAILTAIKASPSLVPENWKGDLIYVPIALLVVSAFLPRAQLPAGPGAPPVLSPPADPPAPPPIAGGAERPVVVRPWPTGLGWVGGVIVVVVALLTILGIHVPNAEWWIVLGIGLWLIL